MELPIDKNVTLHNFNTVWINGSINSGKTTIATLISDEISLSVNIELDRVSDFAHHRLPIDDRLLYTIEDGLDIAANWVRRGYLPILNWPLYGSELVFMKQYASNIGITPLLITLTPRKEVVKKNRGNRRLTAWELDRIDYMYDHCQIDRPKIGHRVDNSECTIAETLTAVLEIIRKSLSKE